MLRSLTIAVTIDDIELVGQAQVTAYNHNTAISQVTFADSFHWEPGQLLTALVESAGADGGLWPFIIVSIAAELHNNMHKNCDPICHFEPVREDECTFPDSPARGTSREA